MSGVINIEFEAEEIERLDAWIQSRGGLESREEAIRRLVDSGMGSLGRSGPLFSGGESMILWMLCDIYKKLQIKDAEVDAELLKSALIGGHYWGLEWAFNGIFHNHRDSGEKVSFVTDVLDMWSFLENDFKALKTKEKDRVKAESPFGSVSFPGFDGNNESEYLGIARFMVEDLDRFSNLGTRKRSDLNSHCPMVADYARMLEVFLPVRKTLVGGKLTADQIIDVLNARKPGKATKSTSA